MRRSVFQPILAVLLLAAAFPAAAAERFVLAQGGGAAAAIVVGEKPCAASTNMAVTLRDMLARITGVTFVITNGDGTAGLAVGMASEFPALANEPALKLAERFGPTDLSTRQGYVLRTHSRGVQLLGASELGAVYAVWDFLYRLGYRQFFPDPAWEIVPHQPELAVSLDEFQKPDYILRFIAGSATPDWFLRNRMNPVLGWKEATALPYLPERWTGSMVQSQHNWGAIIEYAKAEFAAHPEYLGLVTIPVDPTVALAPTNMAASSLDELIKGADLPAELVAALATNEPAVTTRQVRASSKLCVSNPRVRELAALYALAYFEKNPDKPSVSLEPSDGSGWCECGACSNVGPPSERVALMANSVAEALEKTFPEKYVGILAYHLHADPPVRKLHPRVAVSLATGLSGRTPLAERLAGWAKVSENLGVYEYLSVVEWHLGLPAKSLAGNVPRLAETIPSYYRQHVRFYTGQAGGAAWGAHGLGYILTSRLLWDTSAAEHVQEIVDDFLVKAFEEAAEPMREYYRVIDGSQQQPGSFEFFLGRAKLMYAALKEARHATKNPAVRERIDRLVLYTRFVELYALQGLAKGGDRWPARCRFVRHAYRMREKGMVGFGVVSGFMDGMKSVELYPVRRKTDRAVALLESDEVDRGVDAPFQEAEIVAMLEGTCKDPVPEEAQADVVTTPMSSVLGD